MPKPKSIQRATKMPINQCDRLPVSDPINRVGDEPCRQAGPIQRAAQGGKPTSVTAADSSPLFVYGREGKDITQPSLLVNKYAASALE